MSCPESLTISDSLHLTKRDLMLLTLPLTDESILNYSNAPHRTPATLQL